MDNKLIEIPDYSPKEVSYILKIKPYRYGSPRSSTEYPAWFYNDNKENRKKIGRILSRFIFITHNSDPLFCLKKIMTDFPDLKWDKFIIEKEEKFILNDGESFYFIIRYWKIREQIISYIEQSIGKSKELDELKLLFSSKSDLSFEEYLEKKTKMLLSLDLTQWEEKLKKPIKNKIQP